MLRRSSRRIPALSAAHLLPLYGDYTGSETPAQLYINPRGEAVCVDFFDRALPHTIVAGMSRSGKSFLVNHLIQQALPLGASVCILDRWASYDTITEVYKGEYVVINLDRPLCFNPFKGDLGQEHKTFLVALLDQMASGVSGRDAVGFGQEQKSVCSLALQAFAEWHEENRPGEEPVLGDFCELLRDPPFQDEGIGKSIALRMSQYVGKGEYAGFVDGPNALDMTNNLTVFELAGLDKAKDLQSVLLLTLMYRLMAFITNPRAREQRKYLILDEAWALLKQESAAAFLEEAARALARFKCCAMFMTQQVSDFDSPAAQAVKNNAGNYVLLQQNPEQIGIMAELFDLTERERRLLSKSAPARHVGRGVPVAAGRRGGNHPPGAGPVPALAGEPEAAREGRPRKAEGGNGRRPDGGGIAAGTRVPAGPADAAGGIGGPYMKGTDGGQAGVDRRRRGVASHCW